jgi:hypothetical protein
MSWRLVKVIYFATICLPPPLLIVVYPVIFLRRLQVPSWFFLAIEIYFWLGALLLFIELWTSRRQRDTKVLWTVLLLIFNIFTLPIYWFRFLLRDYQQV